MVGYSIRIALVSFVAMISLQTYAQASDNSISSNVEALEKEQLSIVNKYIYQQIDHVGYDDLHRYLAKVAKINPVSDKVYFDMVKMLSFAEAKETNFPELKQIAQNKVREIILVRAGRLATALPTLLDESLIEQAQLNIIGKYKTYDIGHTGYDNLLRYMFEIATIDPVSDQVYSELMHVLSFIETKAHFVGPITYAHNIVQGLIQTKAMKSTCTLLLTNLKSQAN